MGRALETVSPRCRGRGLTDLSGLSPPKKAHAALRVIIPSGGCRRSCLLVGSRKGHRRQPPWPWQFAPSMSCPSGPSEGWRRQCKRLDVVHGMAPHGIECRAIYGRRRSASMTRVNFRSRSRTLLISTIVLVFVQRNQPTVMAGSELDTSRGRNGGSMSSLALRTNVSDLLGLPATGRTSQTVKRNWAKSASDVSCLVPLDPSHRYAASGLGVGLRQQHQQPIRIGGAASCACPH